MRPTVHLVQICNVFGDSIYLPLAAGMLRAYAASQPDLAAVYDFAPILAERYDLEETAARFPAPAVVGISSYVWSHQYSLALARRLRALHPGVVLVLGGPQVPEEARELVVEGPFDAVVHGEGELTFAELLRAVRDGRPLASVAGVTAREGGAAVRAAARPRADDLDAFPSPFLRGDFDLLLQGPRKLIGLWETNRGCPFSCSFCYWGSAVGQKVRAYSWDRLEREVAWFERHRIDYVLCADANFGIKKRDLEIARLVAAAKRRSGAPRKFRVFSTKNASQRVLDVVEVLRAEGLDQGMSLTLQSLSPETLAAIGRENIKLATYVELARAARERGMVTYCDLIVGLPGETYDSFIDGLDRLMTLGQHDNVHVYVCTMLVGSEMHAPRYRAEHQLQVARSPIIERHMRSDAIAAGTVVEYEEVVVATRSMPLERWVETNVTTVLINVLHYQKVAPCLALYLHHEHGVRYRAWYEAVRRASTDAAGFPVLAAAAAFAERFYRSIVAGQTLSLVLPEYGPTIWPVEEAVFLRAQERLPELYQELERVLLGVLEQAGVRAPPGRLTELFRFQRALMPRVHGPEVDTVTLEHDWPAWLEAALAGQARPLQARPTRLRILDQHQVGGDARAFALKVAWYARSAADIPYRLERLDGAPPRLPLALAP